MVDDGYFWNAGYWGPTVGFYGGINYGFGYFGTGFYGGYWNGGRFFYNRAYGNYGGRVHNFYNYRYPGVGGVHPGGASFSRVNARGEAFGRGGSFNQQGDAFRSGQGFNGSQGFRGGQQGFNGGAPELPRTGTGSWRSRLPTAAGLQRCAELPRADQARGSRIQQRRR